MHAFYTEIESLCTRLGLFRLTLGREGRAALESALATLERRLEAHERGDTSYVFTTRVAFHRVRDQLLGRLHPTEVGAVRTRLEAIERRIPFSDPPAPTATGAPTTSAIPSRQATATAIAVPAPEPLEDAVRVIRPSRRPVRGMVRGLGVIRGRQTPFRNTGREYGAFESIEFDASVHTTTGFRCRICGVRDDPWDCFYLRSDVETKGAKRCTHCRRGKRTCQPFVDKKLRRHIQPRLSGSEEESDEGEGMDDSGNGEGSDKGGGDKGEEEGRSDAVVDEGRDENSDEHTDEAWIVDEQGDSTMAAMPGSSSGADVRLQPSNDDDGSFIVPPVPYGDDLNAAVDAAESPQYRSWTPMPSIPSRSLSPAFGRGETPRPPIDPPRTASRTFASIPASTSRRAQVFLGTLVDYQWKRYDLIVEFSRERQRLSILADAAERGFMEYGRALLSQVENDLDNVDIESAAALLRDARHIREINGRIADEISEGSVRMSQEFSDLLDRVEAVLGAIEEVTWYIQHKL